MKLKVCLAAVVFFALASMCFAADDPQMGMWKLNEAKSKMSKDLPKTSTVNVEAAGDQMKVTIDGMKPDGSPYHTEWTGKIDGKEYPVSGDEKHQTTRAYTKVDSHTMKTSMKADGKETMSGTVVISHDGKTRTVTIKGMTDDGKPLEYTAVYDKQ